MKETLGAKVKQTSMEESTLLRKKPKILLTSFSVEERRCLSEKIRTIGGILYESSVRLLYLEIKDAQTITNNFKKSLFAFVVYPSKIVCFYGYGIDLKLN